MLVDVCVCVLQNRSPASRELSLQRARAGEQSSAQPAVRVVLVVLAVLTLAALFGWRTKQKHTFSQFSQACALVHFVSELVCVVCVVGRSTRRSPTRATI